MNESRRFLAYCNEEARCSAHPIEHADGFLDAAVQFTERWASGDGEVSVTVVDCETGEQHCFRVDLDTGHAGAC